MVVALLLAACSRPENFTVEGETADSSDASLFLNYFDGRAQKRVESRAVEGRFKVTGVSRNPTLARLSDERGRVVAAFVIADGDKVRVKADLAEPLKSTVSGADMAEAYAAWVADNAVTLTRGDDREVNDAVARFVGANPASPVSTALITSAFHAAGHEREADSLLRLLDPAALSRPLLGSFVDMLASQLSLEAGGTLQSRTYPASTGKMERFYPRESTLSLVAFTPPLTDGTDTITPLLHRLSESHPRHRLRIMEVSGATDSMSWARYVEADTTATWLRTWTPLAIADRQWRSFAIPSLPFFIVTDSTGSQRLRTHSASPAVDFIRSVIGEGSAQP